MNTSKEASPKAMKQMWSPLRSFRDHDRHTLVVQVQQPLQPVCTWLLHFLLYYVLGLETEITIPRRLQSDLVIFVLFHYSFDFNLIMIILFLLMIMYV